MKIPFAEMHDVLYQLFLTYHFEEIKAKKLAKIFTESTCDGVKSHGINRVPLFIKYVKKGWVRPDLEAEKVAASGMLERWDGKLGAGIINASKCMGRTIELAKKHGMGCIGLRNTNHWMRGGTYGWQAANAGCIAICFTNTQPNMPPWGGIESRIGNNPFVIAIPRGAGHVVLDMALSQFSFGKINDYKLKKEKLPFPGGWDVNNELSNDPEKITKMERGLPIGYWKGSALSIVLDMLAAILSAGDSTFRIGLRDHESAVSQVFICISPNVWGDGDLQEKLLNEIIDYTHQVNPMAPGEKTFYPGERTLENRIKNRVDGIPVDLEVWEEIKNLVPC